jgi:hypothetical protein
MGIRALHVLCSRTAYDLSTWAASVDGRSVGRAIRRREFSAPQRSKSLRYRPGLGLQGTRRLIAITVSTSPALKTGLLLTGGCVVPPQNLCTTRLAEPFALAVNWAPLGPGLTDIPSIKSQSRSPRRSHHPGGAISFSKAARNIAGGAAAGESEERLICSAAARLVQVQHPLDLDGHDGGEVAPISHTPIAQFDDIGLL